MSNAKAAGWLLVAVLSVDRFEWLVKPVAQICGRGPQSRVRIVTDEHAYSEGVYTVLPDSDGAWCSVVATRFGRAEVSAKGESLSARVK